MCKKQKYDVQCYNCKEKYSLKDLKNTESITFNDDNYICWICDKCGNETIIYKGHGYKSHLVDI